MKIKSIHAREILDSRGFPTIEASVELKNGIKEKASVPSGTSKGEYEALELRDNDPKRYQGMGVLKACENINEKIFKVLKGIEIVQQEKIDQIMIDLDGTENKSKLGANAILAVSLACSRVAAKSQNIELYQYISAIYNLSRFSFTEKSKILDSPSGKSGQQLPIPMINIFNGGKHADTNLDFQEFMIIPQKNSFKEMIRKGAEVFHKLKEVLLEKGYDTDVGNEGGFAPDINSNSEAIDLIIEAIKKAGFEPNKDFFLGMDAAASEFYNKKENKYFLKTDKISLSQNQLIAFYFDWLKKYPLISIEDPLEQNDWGGWSEISSKFNPVLNTGQNAKLMVVGDDLFATNIKRLKKGIEEKCANAILIKLNQIGTLSETIKCIKLAKKNNFKIIISHRSGETIDTFISDLAVAVGADFIKAGSFSRGERTAKYNRLMEIEESL